VSHRTIGRRFAQVAGPVALAAILAGAVMLAGCQRQPEPVYFAVWVDLDGRTNIMPPSSLEDARATLEAWDKDNQLWAGILTGTK
jgi:hypothetical protein